MRAVVVSILFRNPSLFISYIKILQRTSSAKSREKSGNETTHPCLLHRGWEVRFGCLLTPWHRDTPLQGRRGVERTAYKAAASWPWVGPPKPTLSLRLWTWNIFIHKNEDIIPALNSLEELWRLYKEQSWARGKHHVSVRFYHYFSAHSWRRAEQRSKCQVTNWAATTSIIVKGKLSRATLAPFSWIKLFYENSNPEVIAKTLCVHFKLRMKEKSWKFSLSFNFTPFVWTKTVFSWFRTLTSPLLAAVYSLPTTWQDSTSTSYI